MRKLCLRIFFSLLLLALVAPVSGVVLAQDGNTTSAAVDAQQGTVLPWYVGVLILIVIFTAVTIYKNRYQATQKKQVLNASCCVPIVDENGPNPFAVIDELDEIKS
jgi:hypothetical protein